MNDQERFLQIARFERTGDPYCFNHFVWVETVERWQAEGLPKEAHPIRVICLGQDRTEFLPVHCLFRFGRPYGNPPYYVAIVPWYAREVINDEGETQAVRDEDGTVYRVSVSNPSAMPQYLEYAVKDWKSWRAYRERLNPHTPDRWPEGWDRIDLTKTTHDHDPRLHGRPWAERDFPLGMHGLSLLGLARNMMGVENLSYALHDNRLLVEDILDHMLYWHMEQARTIFANGIKPDFVWMWEDICYKSGPLFSPKVMTELMIPRWKTYTDFLRSNGVEVILMDCDGNLDEFLPLILEGGLNAIFPLEVAAGNDMLAVREKYGKDLSIVGGIEKQALAEGKGAIDAILEEKVRPMLARGGYFPTLDHYAPPDISFESYMYFMLKLKRLRTCD